MPVSMSIADGKVTVHVPAASGEPRSGEIWLCPVTSKISVDIGRGENHGQTLTYHNVVRRWVKLGDWSGKAESFTIPLSEIPKGAYALKDIDRLDVVVQSGVASKPGLMLGTATAACCGAATN